MPIKAIIFDMGGVLLRTTDQTPREELAKQVGISRRELEMIIFASETAVKAETGEIREVDHWDNVFKTLNIPAATQAEFQRKFWSKDMIDAELIDFIGGLRPRYRTGLLSNAWDGIRPVIETRFPQMLKIFDVTVFSAEVGMRKPDRRYYYWMLEELGVTPFEAIFVDDFSVNVDAAREFGLEALQFKNTQQIRRDILALLDHSAGA